MPWPDRSRWRWWSRSRCTCRTAGGRAPVPAARDVLADSADEETAAPAEDPLIFPDAAMRRRLAIARDVTSAERREFENPRNGIVGLQAVEARV